MMIQLEITTQKVNEGSLLQCNGRLIAKSNRKEKAILEEATQFLERELVIGDPSELKVTVTIERLNP